VDSDGSVYEGIVTAPDFRGSTQLARGARESGKDDSALERTAVLKQNSSMGTASRAVAFRVSGTNRTLKLAVTLDGTFFDAVSSGEKADAANQVQRQSGFATQPLGPSAILRIMGRAKVGPTNEVRIDAVRTD
jgi:hypothetical protein